MTKNKKTVRSSFESGKGYAEYDGGYLRIGYYSDGVKKAKRLTLTSTGNASVRLNGTEIRALKKVLAAID